jgi:formylglycine-generating enzyme required for sulfatase activity
MPAVNINYEQAVEYAKRKNKRLCTSEEWQIVLNEYGDGDIRHNNLYKDYHGGPYQVDNGAGEVKNLLGNVAEWVGDNPDRPGHIGGHWFSATLLQDSLEQATQVISTEGGASIPFVGFRCCRDVW